MSVVLELTSMPVLKGDTNPGTVRLGQLLEVADTDGTSRALWYAASTLAPHCPRRTSKSRLKGSSMSTNLYKRFKTLLPDAPRVGRHCHHVYADGCRS